MSVEPDDLTIPLLPNCSKGIVAATATAKPAKPAYYLAKDTAERGISDDRLVDGVKSLSRRDLPRFFEEFDQVWHW